MTLKIKFHQMLRSNRGQALVEFGLSVPLLALLLFAIVQWGLLLNAYTTLRHAANVTARTVSLAGATTNNATSIATQAISPMLSSANLATVAVQPATVSSANDAVSVTLTYNMPLIVKFVVPGATGNTKTLTATAVYRRGG